MSTQYIRNRVFESSKTPMAVIDPVTLRIIDCNSAAAAVYGCASVEDTIGRLPLDLSAPFQYDGTPSTEKVRYNAEAALTSGSAIFEWRHRRPNGEEWDGEVHLTPFISENRPLLQFTIFDVTLRRRAETALRESESKFRALFEQASVAIVILDEQGVFQECNHQATVLFQLPKTEIVGSSVVRFSPERQQDGRSSVEAAREKLALARSGVRHSFEWMHLRRDGTVFETEVSLTAAETGRGMTIFGFIRDLSEMKRAERERETLQAQLIQSQKMEAVGRLAGGVAHDFNNLLGVIIGHVDLLSYEPALNEQTKDHIRLIEEAAHRSADLTKQLLAFARKQPAAPRALNLNVEIEGILKMLRRIIGENVELSWNAGIDLGTVFLDPSQVDQILANLCVNSRDAVKGVGRVMIETRNVDLDDNYCTDHLEINPGPYVMLAISDNGSGMTEAVRKRIFEPFFTTKPLGKGTGLGLSTVWGIVQQSKGGINVYSEPGIGTTFKIFFPRCEAAVSDKRMSITSELRLGHGETILYVEDEPSLCVLGKSMLERLRFKVTAVNRPSSAIAFVESHPEPIDLLVTDVIMPEMNGKELYNALQKMRPGLKCLYVSGYTANVIVHHGVLDDGVFFLVKPYTLRALADSVFEVLSADSKNK